MKILNDLLKTGGVYSKKSVSIVISFIAAILLGGYIVTSNLFIGGEVNRYAIDVFDSLLTFTGISLGIAEAGKKFINKKTESDTE